MRNNGASHTEFSLRMPEYSQHCCYFHIPNPWLGYWEVRSNQPQRSWFWSHSTEISVTSDFLVRIQNECVNQVYTSITHEYMDNKEVQGFGTVNDDQVLGSLLMCYIL